MGNEHGPVRALVERAILSVAKPKDDKWDELVRELHAIRAEADALDAQTDAAQPWQPVEDGFVVDSRVNPVSLYMTGRETKRWLTVNTRNGLRCIEVCEMEDGDDVALGIVVHLPPTLDLCERRDAARPQWPTGDEAARALARAICAQEKAALDGSVFDDDTLPDMSFYVTYAAAVLARLNGDTDGE